MNDLVSIITPTYNSEKYLEETIKSVQSQTYKNWEMIIIDDCSTDKTVNIIKDASKNDSRIKLITQENNLGPGPTRTRAVNNALGRYIAFLDSDDIWVPEKLERQLNFMQQKGYAFSCTSYEVIADSGQSLKKFIRMPDQMNYIGYLTKNLLQTVTIIVDTKKIDKKLLNMPNIRMGEDAATWIQILKAGYICYGLDEILAKYRRRKGSLSSNKFKSVIGTWHMYRNIVKLPFFLSCYCFIKYIAYAILKRIHI